MKKTILIVVLTALSINLTGCNLVYRQSIQQGNAIEQDEIDKLELGMSKSQVVFLLGTPAIQDSFHQDRWDYVYTFAHRGKQLNERKITLLFEAGELISITGDLEDESAEDEASDDQDS